MLSCSSCPLCRHICRYRCGSVPTCDPYTYCSTVFLYMQVPTLAAAAWMIANDASTATRLTLVPTLFFSLGFLVSAQLGLCTESLAGVREREAPRISLGARAMHLTRRHNSNQPAILPGTLNLASCAMSARRWLCWLPASDAVHTQLTARQLDLECPTNSCTVSPAMPCELGLA